MGRESSYDKRFMEVHDFECTDDKSGLCTNKSCNCAVDLRRNMIRSCVEEYRKNNPKYYLLTLCHPHGICETGRLTEVELGKIKAFNIRRLRKTGINSLRVIGHIDIVLQDHVDRSQRKSRWHVHIHLILWADEPEDVIKQKIYSAYNRFGNKRVAKLDQGSDPASLFSYMVKYVTEHKKKLISSAGWQCRPVYQIKGRFRQELIGFYSSCSIENAFILIGFRRYGIKILPWRR